MKTMLCCIDNIDSNIASYDKYVNVKLGRAHTEQTQRFFEKNIHISSAVIPEVECMQTIITLFLSRVDIFDGICF